LNLGQHLVRFHFYVFDSKWFGWRSLQNILITFFVLSESEFAEWIGVSCWSSPSIVLKKIRNTIGTRFHVDSIDSIQEQPKVVAEGNDTKHFILWR
jgi:hypothetical protein